jgi:uncharacterized lipoprotein
MKITVRQTGGFAGVSVDLASIDTSALDPARAQPIEQLVRQAGFFQLPATIEGPIGADHTYYEVTIADGARQHTVSFQQNDNSAEAAALQRLVATLPQMM